MTWLVTPAVLVVTWPVLGLLAIRANRRGRKRAVVASLASFFCVAPALAVVAIPALFAGYPENYRDTLPNHPVGVLGLILIAAAGVAVCVAYAVALYAAFAKAAAEDGAGTDPVLVDARSGPPEPL